jgi:acyl-coenzyme A thioesterase PaaI-like protein
VESREAILNKLKPLLDHHREVAVEFDDAGMCVVLKKVRPNLLGNFAGGDMAYAANAAAGLLCVAEDRLSETASLNVECIDRADGDVLVGRATIVKSGTKLIRVRVDVFSRTSAREKLVAIAQVNMSPVPVDDPNIKALLG